MCTTTVYCNVCTICVLQIGELKALPQIKVKHEVLQANVMTRLKSQRKNTEDAEMEMENESSSDDEKQSHDESSVQQKDLSLENNEVQLDPCKRMEISIKRKETMNGLVQGRDA